MTFTYDITTALGKIRFEIGDTVSAQGARPNSVNFTDEEINQIYLDEGGSIVGTVVHLLDVLAREWSVVADITLGPRKESFSQIAKAFAQRAEQLRDNSGVGAASTNVKFLRNDGYRHHHAHSPSGTFEWPHHHVEGEFG